MQRAGQAHFNIVYFQVRGAADALYRSTIEPCAVGLCGQLGGTPPYDPLDSAIHEAGKHGLEVHAWLNALTGWSSGSAEGCALLAQADGVVPRHILLDHPDWAMIDRARQPQSCPNEDEYVFLSPSHPEVRARLAAVAADVARRYPVRGIHLDRIRFPGRAWSYDPASLAAFGQSPDLAPDAWDQFRRDLVNQTVRETAAAMNAVDPTLALSASVWEVYRDRWSWGATDGFSGYFQDPLAWARGGYLDVAVPMTYDPITRRHCARADWTCLMDDHVTTLQEGTGRHVYIGINARNGAAEVLRAIALGRKRGAAGFSLYSYRLVDRAGLWSQLVRGPFATPAPVPPHPWQKPAWQTSDGTGGPGEASPAAPPRVQHG